MRDGARCLGTVLLLAACSSGTDASDQAQPARTEERVACALGPGVSFASDCTVERSARDGIVTLVVRHPDGGFRRFDVLDNGRGFVVVDGSEQAVTRYVDGFAEIAIGEDRYRFPVSVQTHAAKP